MKNFIRIILLFAVSALVLSCTKLPATPAAPQGYLKLLALYRSGEAYTQLDHNGQTLDLTLYSGEHLVLTDLTVDNCITAKPKVLGRDKNNIWMLDGVSINIVYNEDFTLDKAYPIYIYYNADALVVHMDNGNSFRIKRTEPKVADIPVIRIKTEGFKPILDKINYVPGTVTIEDPDGRYGSKEPVTLKTGVRGRGNSTWGMPKKPYRLKLEEKSEVLGINSSKNWALLADYADKSLLRNVVAMELSRICGFSWTPAMRKVELYLNDKYQGVYTLAEHKEVAKKKVNIDVDGGDVYLEIEQNQDETVCWWTDHGVPMMFSDPEVPSAELEAETKQFFKEFETALWDKKFQEVYDKYIDLDSFIDYYIVQEIAKNIDGNLRKSTFITRKKGGKLVMYHLWDFDLTLGNCDYYDDGNNGPTGWWIRDRSYLGQYHGWYYRLFMDPNFAKKVRARWDELYPHFQKVPEFIDQQAAILAGSKAAERNFKTWNILNTYVWPNYKIPGSYQGEIDWLKEFYNKRIVWINTNLPK